ncbi:hypothetical protein ACJ7V3_14250 [Halomonas elongata]|uniref:hypothetical protein n=1 Tax=Halomonas elongata TaxID=2746 RepID=UPI0038D3B686
MTKAISTLAIMLTIMGCLVVGCALALITPGRLYWLLFLTELLLICAGFLVAWSSGDVLADPSAIRSRRQTIIKMMALLSTSALMFVCGIWIHHKPRMETSIQQLAGMEGTLAYASHQAMLLFILACLVILCLKLTLGYFQGVATADRNFR